MITGAHALLAAQDADAARAFFRDVLGLPYVDAGGGWLIFALPPAEVGVHPSDTLHHHELYLLCDDIEQTVTELTGKGVEFTSPVRDEGFGRVASFRVPGAGELSVYEPRHPVAAGMGFTANQQVSADREVPASPEKGS